MSSKSDDNDKSASNKKTVGYPKDDTVVTSINVYRLPNDIFYHIELTQRKHLQKD